MFKTLNSSLGPARRFAERFVAPLVLLAMRLYVARVFLTSGWLKLGYVRHNELGTLYTIFENYNVPVLPVKLAAWMGMCGELGCGALLGLGLCSRFGALGLMVISTVIFHTDSNPLAAYWLLICALIASHGPGKLALDNIQWKEKR